MPRANYDDEAWRWLDEIQAGDILYCNGKPRLVREATYHKSTDRHGRGGKLLAVSFAIRKCSWTHSCYTVVTRTDLKTRKFSPSGKRVATMSLVDKLFAHDLVCRSAKKRKLDCCDVKGLL